MKIAVVGGGAIGSLVAAFLSKAGEDVSLIGRRDHVKAINDNGLKIISSQGQEIIKVKALMKLDHSYNLVIFATKTQDLEQAYQDNQDFLQNEPVILTTQNGVQADNMISVHFEPDTIISSIVMFGATYMRPGEITYNFPGDWIIGKPFSVNDSRVVEVEKILKNAFPVVVTHEIVGMKWLKLFVNFNNCIPALIGKSMQETFADIDFCRLSVMLLKEGLDIVRSAHIELKSLPQFPVDRVLGLSQLPIDQGASIINKTLTSLSKEPLYGSILQSIMRKKVSEIDFINGEVVVLARSTGKKAFLNSKVVDYVHRVESSGRFLDPEDVKKEFHLN
jgi:2-dehydropantoate 2-reductase